MTGRPPRLPERLLEWAIGRWPGSQYLLADLREEYAALVEQHGKPARGWYWRQAAGVTIRLAFRSRSNPEPDRPPLALGDSMRTDLVQAVRSLARRPVLAAAIVLTIGGALTATSLAFTLVDGILLRPLPFDQPDRLVTIWERAIDRDDDRNVVSPFNFDAWRRELTTVEALTAVFETSAALTGGSEPIQVGAVLSNGPLFSLIGGAPIAGRYYGADDAAPGAPAVAVISERLWRDRFGADPGIVGQPITINGSARTVVGVIPARSDFAPAFSWGGVGTRDVYLPLQWGPEAWTGTGRFLQVVGRLRPGASLEVLRQEAVALTDRRRAEFPTALAGWSVNPVMLRDDMVGEVATPLTIVFASVVLMLLVACANVANLLLVRAAERRAELAVRSALGAGRWAIARQIFTESALLSGAGAVVGGLLSVWGVAALVAAAPDLPRVDELGVDARLLGFLSLAALVVAALIGVGPALHTAGRDPSGWLSQRGTVTDRRVHRARRILVAVQVAASVVLVVGAGVLVRSVANRLTIDLGFDPANVATAEINLGGERYRDPAVRAATYLQLLERLGALPGVEVATGASIVPMSDKGQATGFIALDRPPPRQGEGPVADVRFVHHDYFKAMRIRLHAGRYLEATDRAGQPPVVLINQSGANALWPNESPIGKRISMEWGDTLVAEIVGVVNDVRLKGPDDPPTRPTLYWDYRQARTDGLALILRGDAAVPDFRAVRAVLAEVDPTVPIYNERSLDALRAGSVAQSRFIAAALALFAILTLGLAALGVYGVVAHGVQQRGREIGVRLALGADRAAVVRMLLAEAAGVVGPALAVGLVAALAASRILRSMVFGIGPSDPLTVAAGVALIAAVATVACWLPARRGASIPPSEAIRAD